MRIAFISGATGNKGKKKKKRKALGVSVCVKEHTAASIVIVYAS